jgi:hypothetical protein
MALQIFIQTKLLPHHDKEKYQSYKKTMTIYKQPKGEITLQ